MSLRRPVALMIHVPDRAAGLAWYRRLFPDATLRTDPDGFEWLDVDGLAIEVVPAHEQFSTGAARSVLYSAVDDLHAALESLTAAGARLYRGLLAIGDGIAMCQVLDPLGNPIGLRGSARSA